MKYFHFWAYKKKEEKNPPLLYNSVSCISMSLSNGINCSWGRRNCVHFFLGFYLCYISTLPVHLIISRITRRGSCLLIMRSVWSNFLLKSLTLKSIGSFYTSKHQTHAFFRTQNGDQTLQSQRLTLQACKKIGVNLTPRGRCFPQQRFLKTEHFHSHFILRFHMQVNPSERVKKWWMHGMSQLYTDQELKMHDCK